MSHPYLKLGKQAATLDPRTLRLASVLNPIDVPDSFDFDELHPGIPPRMYCNDQFGCCVMAGRANQQTRFSVADDNQIIDITDAEVQHEYFRESHGADSGLNMLTSLKEWKRTGWHAGGAVRKIDAFGYINPRQPALIKAAIYSKVGVQIGVQLPKSAMDQFDAGQPFTVVANDGGIEGGHCIYVRGYTPLGIIGETWQQKVLIHWDWAFKYGDEMYGVIHKLSAAKHIVNVPAVQAHLQAVSA